MTSDALSAAADAERMTVPTLPRLLADDETPEALASLLADNGGRLSVMSAEGGLFDTFAGRYSQGVPNLDILLKAHNGTGSRSTARVDRRSTSRTRP